ncbi:LOW QUALITY PROTEIN: hypothetical protein V2J09_008929 [Rumex salicifolius]
MLNPSFKNRSPPQYRRLSEKLIHLTARHQLISPSSRSVYANTMSNTLKSCQTCGTSPEQGLLLSSSSDLYTLCLGYKRHTLALRLHSEDRLRLDAPLRTKSLQVQMILNLIAVAQRNIQVIQSNATNSRLVYVWKSLTDSSIRVSNSKSISSSPGVQGKYCSAFQMQK